MLHAVLIAVAWPAPAEVEPLSRAFWVHQLVSAVASLAFVRWVAWLAARQPGHRAEVIPFSRRP